MSAPAPKQILVTHALPYANGPLHIGHLLGYIQTDVWVRARRMAGDTVHFVAADDVHGTPIMLAAEKAGQTPEEFIGQVYDSHVRDFADFGIAHDYYYTTHSPENRELAELIYARLRAGGHIAVRSIRQLYDPVREMFLPDRYVKGICPNCGTPDQYGDNCENCGATYAPTDLKEPRSVLSGATPELRDSEHYFFQVGDFTALLQDWLAGKLTHGEAVVHPSVAAKLKEWLDAEGGVRDWDISRDAPYFGFPIPDAPGKFFYVWLDAPIGYLASFKKYCASDAGAKNGLTPASFDAFLQTGDAGFDPNAEMHHFLGKDIVNFHGLFWPAMLKGAALRTPTALHVNGYLTVNGEKMSKSRGTFVMARTYLDAGLEPDWLRYYFATMLTAAPVDLDLDLKAFEDRVNSHLVGKWVNIASRCAGFVHKFFGGRLAAAMPERERALYDSAAAKLAGCAGLYDACDYAGAMRRIVEVADEANAYVAEKAPWQLAKDERRREELHLVCTLALNYFRLLSIWLSPVVPDIARRARALLREDWTRFAAADAPALGIPLDEFTALTTRIDAKKIDAMIEASKESLQPAAASVPATGTADAKKAPASSNPQSPIPNPGLISIDDFAKLDLRVGKVLACEFVEGSDKLLRFELDAGDLGTRQIFSGIRAAYGEPSKLVGRNVVFIANLAPRKMRFGTSEGMILSAGSGGSDLFLLDADAGAVPGAAVK
ncbi:methionine--tRNA ligase [Dokdonella sp.]|uniref:methionine--tRNA ligase n=1 Tax=Dokdonella sp. TaxID=2291710 RepID=UPI001B1B6AA0|nr:methionine--tRNA ligase [Dokdonella sp.]MBO9662620.1 methionine--tRNA ligase [Dokdonella sp.]